MGQPITQTPPPVNGAVAPEPEEERRELLGSIVDERRGAVVAPPTHTGAVLLITRCRDFDPLAAFRHLHLCGVSLI